MEAQNRGLMESDKTEKVFQDVAFYSLIIESLPVGILTVNPKMKVTRLNRWAERIMGYSEKEAGDYDDPRVHPPIAYHETNADEYKHPVEGKIKDER